MNKIWLFFLLTTQLCFAENIPEGMVKIPGGTFLMGSKNSHSKPDETPRHAVKLNDFWLDAPPVTNRQFKAFVDATGYVTTAEKPPLH